MEGFILPAAGGTAGRQPLAIHLSPGPKSCPFPEVAYVQWPADTHSSHPNWNGTLSKGPSQLQSIPLGLDEAFAETELKLNLFLCSVLLPPFPSRKVIPGSLSGKHPTYLFLTQGLIPEGRNLWHGQKRGWFGSENHDLGLCQADLDSSIWEPRVLWSYVVIICRIDHWGEPSDLM